MKEENRPRRMKRPKRIPAAIPRVRRAFIEGHGDGETYVEIYGNSGPKAKKSAEDRCPALPGKRIGKDRPAH
jgi:hypothetical protein